MLFSPQVAAAKSLAKATATFTRALSLVMVPPTPRQPCYEVLFLCFLNSASSPATPPAVSRRLSRRIIDQARIIYERLDAHRHVPALLRLHGALKHAERSPIVRIWGRQILLALKAAHEVIFTEI